MSVIFFGSAHLGNLAGALTDCDSNSDSVCELLSTYSEFNAVAYALHYGDFAKKGLTKSQIKAALPSMTQVGKSSALSTAKALQCNGPDANMFGDTDSSERYHKALSQILNMAITSLT